MYPLSIDLSKYHLTTSRLIENRLMEMYIYKKLIHLSIEKSINQQMN